MNAQTKILGLIDDFQSPRDSNGTILGLSIGQWLRYYNFLLILKEQHEQLSSQFQEMSVTIETETPEDFGEISNSKFEKFSALNCEVQLQFEAFYLFSKILLDRTADSFNYYFDLKGSMGGSSYSKMQREFDSSCRNKNLVNDRIDFSEVMAWLQEHLVKDRNKKIEHTNNPRLIHGFGPGSDNSLIINRMVFYPSDSEDNQTKHQIAPSKSLKELFQKLDLYLIAMVEFLETNKEKIKPKS